MIPTAEGAAATGTGEHQATIPPQAKQQIEKHGGAKAALITKVVRSQSYGAPARFQAQPAAQPTTTVTTTTSQTPTTTTPRPKTTTHKPSRPQQTAPAYVATAPAPLPPAPGTLSSVFGTVGAGGVLFALALVGVLGFAALPRVSRS
jgi:hypothetical protein